MALNQQQCATIAVGLSPILGEEVAAAVANEFAHFDYDQLVTKDFLRAELQAAISNQTRWMLGIMLTWGTLLVAAVGLLR